MLLKGHRAIRADRVDVIGIENSQAGRLHFGNEFLSVSDKKAGIDGMVFHSISVCSKVGSLRNKKKEDSLLLMLCPACSAI
jgi:hypothetical protein